MKEEDTVILFFFFGIPMFIAYIEVVAEFNLENLELIGLVSFVAFLIFGNLLVRLLRNNKDDDPKQFVRQSRRN